MWFFACLPLCACQSDTYARRYGRLSGGRAPPKSLLVPPKQELCPPSEDCAPKKLTGSVPLKCSSRAKTPKILVIAQEFVGKNSFFADFAVKTFFFGFTPESVEFHKYFAMKTFVFWSLFSTKFLFLPKIVYAPAVHRRSQREKL